ncbi:MULTISPECIES: VWA domain-containing protein [Nostoc]|uniref:VWA domain-containing protein n=1 Tax=Nostoc paludosum FACHB-159 TaxID=2692908 RepID=A0ABR8K5P4_9NOSO|nr:MULTISPECIES: VWA domain-containing protein [Nostoc]MBD2677505.1 VWA domain-containing protein [Nostoc sp. FACHB-857]MBD2734101.1 VWA domain-containing protein [Nostoc paludosum FACHB-159]
MNDPALLELFTCLQKAGFPLGLAEYHLLLEAINAGFGTRDRTSLAQLCSALWVKSQREEQIFQDYFNQIIPERLEEEFFPKETNSTYIELRANQNKQPTRKKYNIIDGIILFLKLGFVGCVVAIASIFFLKKPTSPNENHSIYGTLVFDKASFFVAQFTANEADKTAKIKIIRTKGNYGAVSAILNVSENISEASRVDTTPQVIQFAHGEKVKTIQIPINNNNKAELDFPITLSLSDPQGGVKLDENSVASLTIQDDDGGIFAGLKPFFDNLELLWFTATCIIFMLLFWKLWKIRQTFTIDEALIPETYTNLSKTMLSAEVIRTMADEIQVAKAIRQSDNQLREFPLIVNDLPVTHRQMKQGWRYLRRFSREGPPSELDLAATIQQVAQYGILLNPVLVPRRTNRIELLLLIDTDGSMVPFHHLCEELVDTALRGGRFSQVRVYYFHNCPDEYLYRDRYHLEAEPIDDCLSNLPKARTVCLIFSDAGAARGGLNSRRRRLTKFFLKELGQYVRYTTWLNPVPRARWETTTAHDIAALVAMFELNRQEFYRAIDILRGRTLR